MKHGWAVILGVCALVYANSLQNSFHYDDEHSILDNLHIRDLGNISSFFQDPATFSRDADKGMYRPLLLLTYALNHAYGMKYGEGGYDVVGYHVVNLLLHALSACLIWWLTSLMFGRKDVSLAAGLLFALHPLATEPVNYISSRSESLAAMFYLLGMVFFVEGEKKGKGRMVLSWAALALGLLCKSTVITMPAVLLLFDYLFCSRRDWGKLKQRLFERHIPYWVIAGGYVALIWVNGFLSGSVKAPVRDGWTQFLTQIKGFVFYWTLLLWPLGLNVEHQFFEQRSLEGVATFGALLLVLSFLGMLVYLFFRRKDLPFFLMGWGLVAMLPVMVVPLNVLVNERRLYLPCAAFCIGLALLLRSERARKLKIGGRDLGIALMALILLGYGLLSFERNRVWKDDFSLWGDAVSKAPMMPRVHLYLGNTHKEAAFASADSAEVSEHWKAARRGYQKTVELDPQGDLGLRAFNNLGAVNFVLDDIDAAEKAYRRAVEISPQYADAIVNLGTISHERVRRREVAPDRQRQTLEQAIRYYQQALGFQPNHPYAHANMGLAYFDLGEWEKAHQSYERAYFLRPRDDKLLNNMGNLFATLGQQRPGAEGKKLLLKARQLYLGARRINPANPSPQRGLQYVEGLLNSGKW